MTVKLAQTLGMVAEAASCAREAWWIIGSAAVALHGRPIARVNDVDLLMSAGDAEAFLRSVGEPVRSGEPSERFRSRVFGRWSAPPLAVEVMGGFCVASDQGWSGVALQTREAVSIAGADVYVPSAQELAQLLVSFGRAKDLERAALMRS